MQRFKPLLPLNGSTVIEHVVKNFRKAGIEDITIVAGHNAEALRQGVESLGVRVVFNSQYAEGMYSSVVAGIRALEAGVDGCLLIPADMPLVRSSTVTRVCSAFRSTGASVVYPVFQKRRGHPTLISSRLFPAILSGDGVGGLRALLAEHDSEAHEERVPDEGILIDLDTPADYVKAQERVGQLEIPTLHECEAILDELAGLRAHRPPRPSGCRGRRKAYHSVERCRLAPQRCPGESRRYFCMTWPRANRITHGQGARILEDLGFAEVARVVGLHMDCDFQKNAALDEAAIVYLADKLVQGDRVVSLAERFQRKFAAARGNGTLPFVQKRWETAQRMVGGCRAHSGCRYTTDYLAAKRCPGHDGG